MGTVLSILPAVLSSVSPSQSTSVWPSTSKSQDAGFASASALASNSKLEELLGKIEFVENWAIAYCALTNQVNPANQTNVTLAYLRTFNASYCGMDSSYSNWDGFAWSALAGLPDPAFSSTVDAMNENGYYFSQFVNGGAWGYLVHAGDYQKHPRGETYDMVFFDDPLKKNNSLDLLHLFASIDGTYDYTLSTGAIAIPFPISANIAHDIASWAGDLQSLASETIGEHAIDISKYLSFKPIMEISQSCSYQDVIADIDAVNISYRYLGNATRLSDAMRNYYTGILSSDRGKIFQQAVLDDANEDWPGSSREKFIQEVHDMLGLKKSGSSWYDSEEYLEDSTFLSDPVNYAKYYLLKKNGNVPLQTRIKIADLFCDYVFELC